MKQCVQAWTVRVDIPAAFRRLCVETIDGRFRPVQLKPAAFRRLCVETKIAPKKYGDKSASRLQAAVC